MKFSKVSLSYGPNDEFIFPMEKYSINEPYVIKGITGLDPPPITVGTKKNKAENREISILFGLRPNYKAGLKYDDLRTRLYSLLTPKFGYPLVFSLMDQQGNYLASVAGDIKTFEAGIFSKTPDIQVVITCKSAYLDAPRFVLPNPTTEPTSPLMIENIGSAPTGFTLMLTINEEYGESEFPTNFTLSKATFGEVIKFTSSNAFGKGDVIYICTEEGKCEAYQLRNYGADIGDYPNYDRINLLASMTATSEWFKLHGGYNSLLVKLDDDYITRFSVNHLSFTPRYWGV
jgi:hypothetical protein